jgi:hypothetical protein
MGHSDVHITKIYLEDLNSTQARKEHTNFSPISAIQLKRFKKGEKKRKKSDTSH